MLTLTVLSIKWCWWLFARRGWRWYIGDLSVKDTVPVEKANMW